MKLNLNKDMKPLVALLLLVMMAACAAPADNTAGDKKVRYKDTPRGISIQRVDGCDYIYCETPHGVAITHKQNCSNHHP